MSIGYLRNDWRHFQDAQPETKGCTIITFMYLISKITLFLFTSRQQNASHPHHIWLRAKLFHTTISFCFCKFLQRKWCVKAKYNRLYIWLPAILTTKIIQFVIAYVTHCTSKYRIHACLLCTSFYGCKRSPCSEHTKFGTVRIYSTRRSYINSMQRHKYHRCSLWRRISS